MSRKIKEYRTRDGAIRMVHGDARSVLPKLMDRTADLIFTDPPYGHNNNNGDLIHRREVALGEGPKKKGRPIVNDGPEAASHLFRFLMSESSRLLKRKGSCCCCCCGGGGPDPQSARWCYWMDQSLAFKQMVVWDKGRMGMGWHYRRSYETILVAQRAKGRCEWHDKSKKVENIIRPGDYGIRKIRPRETQHPTAKPVALPAHFIGLHSRAGDIVLDPFMGHASTGAACVRSGRRFIGIEVDQSHFEVAVERIKQERRGIATPG